MKPIAPIRVKARHSAPVSRAKASRPSWYTGSMQSALSAAHAQWLDKTGNKFSWLAVGARIEANNREFQVVRRLGGGAQAEIFLVNEGKQQRALKLFPTSENHVQHELAELKSAGNGMRVLKDYGIVTGLRFPNRFQPYNGIVFEYVRGLPLDSFLLRTELPGLDPKVRDVIRKQLEPLRSGIEKVGYKNVLFDLDRGEPVVIDPH